MEQNLTATGVIDPLITCKGHQPFHTILAKVNHCMELMVRVKCTEESLMNNFENSNSLPFHQLHPI